MHRVQKTDRESAARPHPAPCGEVAIVVNLHPARNFHEAQNLTSGRMCDLVDRLASLDFRPNDPKPVIKERRQITTSKIAILINARCQYRAAVLAIPGGVVGPA